MNIFSRRRLSGAVLLILLLGACNLPAVPPPVSTESTTATVETQPTLPTSTSELSPTAFIPITGMDVVSLQCQFCVKDQPHAVLIMSNQASFSVADPANGITCASAQEVNGQRILLCRGTQQSTFTLNVCVDANNCLQFPVTLQPCPLIPETGVGIGTPFVTSTPLTPIFLTPFNTLIPRPSRPRPTQTDEAPPLPTSTAAAATPQPTSTSGTSPLPTATDETIPTATEPPPAPTEETPAPTAVPTGG
jgi:hypothetical protein